MFGPSQGFLAKSLRDHGQTVAPNVPPLDDALVSLQLALLGAPALFQDLYVGHELHTPNARRFGEWGVPWDGPGGLRPCSRRRSCTL